MHDPLDHELLEEAQHLQPAPSQPSEHLGQEEEKILDDHLSWVPRETFQPHSSGRLTRPVLIPQNAPGLQQAFSRAWAPNLADHGFRPDEFLQFIDHLNVCKAASPPFQVLNLAGTILGFTPIPSAQLISLGVSAAAVGGTVATSRARIAHYIGRVNKEYFMPRGLQVRVAKQNLVPEITRQPASAPLLADPGNGDPATWPSFRDRRLMALGDHVARLEFANLSAPKQEGNALDKLSAKMLAKKTERQTYRIDKNVSKEKEKLGEEMEKLDKEARKVEEKARKEMRKKPEDMRKIERKRLEDMAEIDKDRREKVGDFGNKIGKGGKDEDKSARKFLLIVVQDLQDMQAR